MKTRLPTEQEINVFDSLDERSAVKNFLGKDLDQAQSLFRENFFRYQEDLMCMGPIAFRFYVVAALAHLLSAQADHDLDEARSFCSLIEFRLDYEPAEIAPVGSIIREAILRILDDFERYGTEINFTGDFAGRYRALPARLEALPHAAQP
jgi:hypothetical protein